MQVHSIDIFCQVIDNFGDIGVCYRLYKDLRKRYSEKVQIRLIVDRLEEFYNLCEKPTRVNYLSYQTLKEKMRIGEKVAEVVLETFGCEIPKEYLEKAYENSKCIINIDYFSAEAWTEEFHLQESMTGKPCRKFFFMPGVSPKTGGILQGETSLKLSWKEFGILREKYDWVGSIFSYEKDFQSLIKAIQKTGKKVCLCVLGEKSQNSIRKSLGNFLEYDKIHLEFLPFYSQEKYEALLRMCDFNFVRGEDSFARALLTRKPFLWHIYPQEEKIHLQKLKSFLEQYCPEDENLQKVFFSYNEGETDYTYFFEHFSKIQEKNQKFCTYIQEHCNLGIKLKQFIEKF